MLEGTLYLVSSFWLGALHAATPGHGKTISAAYIVGMRGRATDAVALGIFVTVSHTSGIALFALLATLGSSALSQRSEGYVALGTALLIVALGLQMLWSQRHGLLRLGLGSGQHRDTQEQAGPQTHEHATSSSESLAHSHGWPSHSHRLDLIDSTRPSWAVLLGLGLAGGLLPDPAALAVLLAAIATGKLVLGLCTVLVFSLGFASVLVVVGAAAGRLGQLVVKWLNQRWLQTVQVATAAVIVGVGVALTIGAWRQVVEWR